MYEVVRITSKIERMNKALDGCTTEEGCEMITRWIQQWMLILHLKEEVILAEV